MGFDFGAFDVKYLQAALLVSLLSVWMLVGLFYYLNRYTRREYFTVWTAAWLFYALWLTLSINLDPTKTAGGQMTPPEFLTKGDFKFSTEVLMFMLKQACVAISAIFLLWGSLRFLDLPVSQKLFGLFMLFMLIWIFVSPHFLKGADPRLALLQVQLPVFILLGLGSVFAGVCFYRLRSKMPFVGAGMLALGFLLWGIYLGTYPLSQQDYNLYSAGFFAAAVLQLFIAVSMIVLVLEEVRYKTEKVLAEIAAVRSEKEALQVKVLTTEEQCRNLYDEVRSKEGTQKAYEELRQTQQVVVQQERLRALGQMASGIAHDINNSLSPIVAYSELLLATLPHLSESARGYLQNMQRSARDIASIVRRMRDFYRRRSGTEQLEILQPNRIVEEVIELTRPRWRDISQRSGVSILVEGQLDPQAPALLGDATELREALTNLIFNSVDAMPQGGLISLVTRGETQPAGTAGITEEQRLVLEVRDNGLGMNEDTRQRCLEPFFSTKFQRGGTGLGLAMVYGMVQRHEGRIDVESTVGQGTCIRLTLPVRTRIPQAEAAPARPQVQRGLRLLCIDDEASIRQMLEDCLRELNHDVTLAETGQQGLRLFRDALHQGNPFEVVITDLGMPDLDGRQVARSVKAASPTTPVVMLTGWAAQMKEDGETLREVDAVLGKPPSITELNGLLLKLANRTAPKA